MGRGLLSALVLLAVSTAAAGGEGDSRPAGASPPCSADDRVGVDRLEGARAVLLQPGGRRARVVPRSALPPGAREGDVLVGGRLQPECRRQLREQVGRLRALRVGQGPGTTRALTAGGEH